MSPHPSDRDLVVLHTLRCIGFAGEDRVASAALMDRAEARASLDGLLARGLVSHLDGVFGGWGLTDQGRVVDGERVAAELDLSGSRETVEQAYGVFLPLNPRLLQICHDWQLHGAGGAHLPNDHRDAEYDLGVIERLVKLDRAAQPVLASLSDQLTRFGAYRTRLTAALDRVEAGEHDYLTESLDSYHTVWFQLHEDLLATLGIARAS